MVNSWTPPELSMTSLAETVRSLIKEKTMFLKIRYIEVDA